MYVCVLSSVWLFVTPWTVAHQVSLSMGFSRKEYWRGLPFPSSGGLPDPGIELTSPAFPACQEDSLPLYHLGSLLLSWKASIFWVHTKGSDLPTDIQLLSVPEAEWTWRKTCPERQRDLSPLTRPWTFSFNQSDPLVAGIPGMSFQSFEKSSLMFSAWVWQPNALALFSYHTV